MKEIKAIIRPSTLDKVLGALHAIKGLPGCIVSHVHGYARSDGLKAAEPEFAEFAKLEIVVADGQVDKVLEAVRKNAHSGNPGDGKMFVIACADVVAIRTGTRGKSAI